MLIGFFYSVKKHKVPCTVRELLDLINALEHNLVFADIDAFYLLSRTILVKDESYFDRFDCAFAEYFKGISAIDLDLSVIPDEWLKKQFEKQLTQAEKDQIKALGGLDKLLETLQKRLNEQEKRHQGGNKWIGTGGTSPFGAYGYNPEGIRIGQDGNNQRRAVKVWDKREFKNLDANAELGTRNIKMALRKLRQFARTGASDLLDIEKTISATAKNAGCLDIKMMPERHNAVKVLIFFDVGGSMDDFVRSCEQLFSAVHTEFKHLAYFYFHNCLYESVWQDNHRRFNETIDLTTILHKYGRDYKVIIVGDATMGPYEITHVGGSVEHWNQLSGSHWLTCVFEHFEHCIWLNPQAERYWHYYPSINIIQQLINQRMYPLTVDGLTKGIKALL